MNNTPIQLLKVAQWNARSFRNHIHEFYDFMTDNSIQLACISETNFKTTDIAPSHQNYKLCRLDRTSSTNRSGGVAIFVDRNIIHEVIEVPKTKLVEAIGLKIRLTNGFYITFYSIYLSGGANNQEINQYLINQRSEDID